MSKNNYLFNIIEELAYENGLVGDLAVLKDSGHSLKYNLAKQAFNSISEIEQIYFSGDYPLIYFKSLDEFDVETIKRFHKKIWNQGRVPMAFISTPNELRIYNCYREPLKEDDKNIDSLEIDRFENSINELLRLKENYHQERIDSGLIWDSYIGKKLATARKVDQLLVRNLKETRRSLLQLYPKKNKTSLSYIHNLLGRSLFILYLQDRGIINRVYYNKFLDKAVDYFSILANKEATFQLYKELNERFNGDLFTVTDDEEQLCSLTHLDLVRKCFYGDDVKTGQLSMWRVFDFSFIPIELISSIYEEFLHTEEGDLAISNYGAYYTPLPLVEFVLNEVLPYPDKHNQQWNLKVLDPACGSGIFLVEAYRRLIERWRYANGGQSVSIEILRQILTNCIFGVELNQEAIKVASFSLYLTILNYLEPKSIWANSNVTFPHLINSENKNANDQGGNLFHADTFENESYSTLEFNLIIGNPPWKRGNLSPSLTTYIKKFNFANEAVIPFLHKMVQIAPLAKIALVSTAKILFNHSGGYRNFRNFLFNETTVSTIVNFSQLRHSRGEIGKKLFQSATGASCLIIYQGKMEVESQDICYCTPKPNFRDSSLSEIIIDSSDIKFLPRVLTKEGETSIWKVGMYGTLRDLKLLKKLKKGSCDIKTYSEKLNWRTGCGFQTSEPKKFPNNDIKKIKHLPATAITRYYSTVNQSINIEDIVFRREGTVEAYKAPHVLIKAGQTKKEFCSSFIDFDCSFRDTVYGISAPNDTNKIKALSTILNSTFATYFFFLTSSNWGIGREKMNFDEIMRLPIGKLLDKVELVEALSLKMDAIINLKTTFKLGEFEDIKKIENEIDVLLFEALTLSKTELFLIKNVVETSLDFFQEGAKSKAITRVSDPHLKSYLSVACDNFEKLLGSKHGGTWAKVYKTPTTASLKIVSFHFNAKQENGLVFDDKTSDVNAIINKLNNVVYQQHSESVYFRKIVKYYESDVLFLVKPNESRFWTEAVALDDSDNIAIELIVNDVD